MTSIFAIIADGKPVYGKDMTLGQLLYLPWYDPLGQRTYDLVLVISIIPPRYFLGIKQNSFRYILKILTSGKLETVHLNQNESPFRLPPTFD